MQQLILMRHAQAQPAAPSGGDRDRALNAAGRAEAQAMGRALKARNVRPDLALVSSARRTRETWSALAEGLEIDPDPDWLKCDAALYNAGGDTLRRHVEAAEDRCDVLVMIAHNPGVHQLAFDLLNEAGVSGAVLDRVRAGFAPGTAALFRVDVAGRCTYDGLITPEEALRT